jgi:hypothetical protein
MRPCNLFMMYTFDTNKLKPPYLKVNNQSILRYTIIILKLKL